MYARINAFTRTRETSDDDFAQWHDLIAEQPGFLGYLILDKGNRQELAITLWETRDAHQAWAGDATFRRLLRAEHEQRIATWTTDEAIVTRFELHGIATTPSDIEPLR
jgi:heme-degrading monooxygenase HmoA